VFIVFVATIHSSYFINNIKTSQKFDRAPSPHIYLHTL